ncbi:MAG: FlgD immunoglobulin-like domain containing protein [Candidatus Kapaibacterium sp.]
MQGHLRYPVLTALILAIGLVIALKTRSQIPPAPRSYIGTRSCTAGGCHYGPYGDSSIYKGAKPFFETMHQRIHLKPSPETVVIDRLFDNDTVLRKYLTQIRAVGKDTLEVHLSKSDDRKDYYIQLKFSGGGDSTPKMKVAYTYGGNGWIQRYLVRIDSSYYTPPFQYVMPGYRNRSSFGGGFYYLDLDKWFAVDPVTSEGKFFQWNTNIFRGGSWDKNCAACHVTGFDVARKISGTDTAWKALWIGEPRYPALSEANILIGCESCHGPGSEHANLPSRNNIISPGRAEQFPYTMAGTDRKLDLCNQCHTRFKSTGGIHGYAYDDSLSRPFTPGENLAKFIKDPYAAMDVWVDGVTSHAHHQTGQDFLRSKPYAEHVFENGCWSCHLPHENGANGLPYQLDRNWYSLERGEGCLASGCHMSYGDTAFSAKLGRMVNLHTEHAESDSKCVNCHFTKTATIGFVELPDKPLFEFSSHSFHVIRPTATIENGDKGVIGMINTCAESCHRNGRGSRNMDPASPAAPAFGIVDGDHGNWKEKSDIALADSLWNGYQRLYDKYLLAVRLSPESGELSLNSIAPNPVKGIAVIRFTLPRREVITLSIYDMAGRFIRTVAAGEHEAGEFQSVWDGGDELGRRSPPGAYIIRLTTSHATRSLKAVLQ